MALLSRVLCLVSIYIHFTELLAYSLFDIQRLIEDKKKNYNKKLRPSLNQSETTYVYMNMELLTIQEFDEVSEKFSAAVFVNMFWKDDLLAWDPNDYGGMKTFPSEVGDFWRPPIILVTPYTDIDIIGKDWNIQRHGFNGYVYVTPGHIFESSCGMDVTYYPWDQQTCAFSFNPWGYLAKEITLISTKDKIGTGIFPGHGSWDVVDTNAESAVGPGETSFIQFVFILNRKPLFVLVNIILPIVFMSFLNMLVFWIPTESGERISYCLTVLLAIAVFLTLVGDNLPKKSEPMCLLSFYLLGILILSLCIVLATICSLAIYFREESKTVPRCLSALVRCFACKCKSNKKYRYTCNNKHDQDEQQIYIISKSTSKRHVSGDRGARTYVPNDRFVLSYDKCLKPFHDPETLTPESNSSKSGSRNRRLDSSEYIDDDKEGYKTSWKDVSYAFDIMFFLFFVCFLVTMTTLYFVTVLSNKP